MLRHPTIDKLHELRLSGMATALTEQHGLAALSILVLSSTLVCSSSAKPVCGNLARRQRGCAAQD